MATHTATVLWERKGAAFTDNKYSRGHRWIFDGGVEVPASSAPSVVPAPLSVAEAVDPEEAFAAALSSCHMLFFLAFAAKKGFVVERYRDEAVAEMGKNAAGRTMVARVTLRPRIEWAGEKRPTAEDLDALHHASHEHCFIANSVACEVVVEPPPHARPT